MATVTRRSVAEQDLEEAAVYIGQNGVPVAKRFLHAADRAFDLLASMPGIGALFPLANPSLQGLRHHSIKGFPKHIIFYLPTADGIEVVRVLHGARNIADLLEGEP